MSKNFRALVFALLVALIFGFGLSARAGGPLTLPNVAGTVVTTNSSAADVSAMVDLLGGAVNGNALQRTGGLWAGSAINATNITAGSLAHGRGGTNVSTTNTATNLWGYWTFDDAVSPANLADSSGNGRSLQQGGNQNATFPTGLFGQAADNGSTFSNRFLNRASQDATLDFAGDFTVAFWLHLNRNPGGGTVMTIVATGSIGNDGWQIGVNASDTIRFSGTLTTGSFDFGATASQVNSNDGNWHHYVCTREQNVFRIWVDGVVQGTNYHAATSIFAIKAATKVLTVLGRNQGTTVDQTLAYPIDELGIWTRALTYYEIYYLYNQGAGRTTQ